jgi:hypothetical protein
VGYALLKHRVVLEARVNAYLFEKLVSKQIKLLFGLILVEQAIL